MVRAIDGCVLHEWPSGEALRPYLPEGWRDLLVEVGASVNVPPLYPGPADAGVAPHAFEALRDGLLGSGDRERVVLTYDAGLRATTNQNHFVGMAVAEAANRWTEEEWLQRDERLFGLIAAPGALPDQAAAEVRRSGENPRMVGVALGSAALGTPLGHPVYHPIYEAAAELGLPLVLQAGVDATPNAVPTPVVGGLPATGAEYRALSWQTQMAHVSSLIMQGVFDRFPDLRVLLVGAGAVWLPGHLWRVDHRFSVTRGDGRWLERRPSEYADRFFVATHRLEQPPRSELLARALSALPDVEHRLIYASGYPDAGWQEPEAATKDLPAAWRPKVLRDNALALFRFPDRRAAEATETAALTV